MFECNIDLVFEILRKEFESDNGGAEFFHDIHCPDPFDKKREFIFPVVAVHSTGLYLVYLLDNSAKQAGNLEESMDYACRVFKSYFFTKVPIHSVFAFETLGRNKVCSKPIVYDYASKHMPSNDMRLVDDLGAYIRKHVESSSYPSDAEREELVLRLVKEESESLMTNSDSKSCFVKKGDKWLPAFNVDSDKVYNLALFGGLLGFHRFYLGLYGSGLLYFFTLGIFGAGWLFDCIEILLGGRQ